MTTRISFQSVLNLFVLVGGLAVASASSPNVRVLTDADFDQATSQGSWLIEFFAPW